jgi:hypothetical protein
VGLIAQPSSFIAPGKDLPGTVGLTEEGQKLTVPLFVGSSANLTAMMKTMTLIVEVEKETRLEFALKQ